MLWVTTDMAKKVTTNREKSKQIESGERQILALKYCCGTTAKQYVVLMQTQQ